MIKKLSHNEFIEKLLERNEHYKKGKFEVIGKYINSITPIILKDKYGEYKIRPNTLISRNTKPSLSSVIDRNTWFIRHIKEIFTDNKFTILSKFNKYGCLIYCQNKYGICKVTSKGLLNGYPPSIESAVDKTSYFENLVYEKNKHFRKGKFSIVSKYKGDRNKIKVKTKYGICSVTPYFLTRDNNVSIRTALDKNKYLLNQFKEVHGDVYDYNINFKSAKTKVKIVCKKHGVFEQSPDSHKKGHECPICSNEKKGYKFSEWKKACKGNKGNFYVIECFNKEERFLKIGITCKNTIEKRYHSKKSMPYNYILLKWISNDDRETIWNLEKYIKKELKKFKYIPNKRFGGDVYEVFDCNKKVKNLIDEKIKNFDRNIK